jgi:hypothetical protein
MFEVDSTADAGRCSSGTRVPYSIPDHDALSRFVCVLEPPTAAAPPSVAGCATESRWPSRKVRLRSPRLPADGVPHQAPDDGPRAVRSGRAGARPCSPPVPSRISCSAAQRRPAPSDDHQENERRARPVVEHPRACLRRTSAHNHRVDGRQAVLSWGECSC